MKSLIFSIVIVSAFVCSGQSQFGVTGGFNISTLLSQDDTKAKLGYRLGIYSERDISEMFGLRSEFIYSEQGAEVAGAKLAYSYIQIPVMLRYNRVYIGPQLGLLFSATSKQEGMRRNITGSLNNLDISGIYGALFPIAEKSFFDFRISYSFSSTNKEINGTHIPNFVISGSIVKRLK